MNTDDLTEMAWGVIARAACVSDTLKADLGAMACRFQSEDEWLRGVRAHLEGITEDPADYVDAWDLENEEGVTAAMIGSCAAELCLRVNEILAIPLINGSLAQFLQPRMLPGQYPVARVEGWILGVM